MKLRHPVSDDLAFLYGTILTDGKDNYSTDPTANICVFAEAQVLNGTGAGKTPPFYLPVLFNKPQKGFKWGKRVPRWTEVPPVLVLLHE